MEGTAAARALAAAVTGRPLRDPSVPRRRTSEISLKRPSGGDVLVSSVTAGGRCQYIGWSESRQLSMALTKCGVRKSYVGRPNGIAIGHDFFHDLPLRF